MREVLLGQKIRPGLPARADQRQLVRVLALVQLEALSMFLQR
jgi:hypothetical protein